MIQIEDEQHAELQGQYSTFEDAVDELKRREAIPWDQSPNRAPCKSWRTCGRKYEIVEYDAGKKPWRQLRRIPALEISSDGARWTDNFRELWESRWGRE